MKVMVSGPSHVPFPVGGEGSRHDNPRSFGLQGDEERCEAPPQDLGLVGVITPDVQHQGQEAGMFLQDRRQHPGQVLHLGSTEAEGLRLTR